MFEDVKREGGTLKQERAIAAILEGRTIESAMKKTRLSAVRTSIDAALRANEQLDFLDRLESLEAMGRTRISVCDTRALRRHESEVDMVQSRP